MVELLKLEKRLAVMRTLLVINHLRHDSKVVVCSSRLRSGPPFKVP